MKRLFLMCIIALVLPSCKSCQSSHIERVQGVKKVCSTCNFVESQGSYYAVDTAKQPNIIYIVRFKGGGVWYTASDVDDLIRVN